MTDAAPPHLPASGFVLLCREWRLPRHLQLTDVQALVVFARCCQHRCPLPNPGLAFEQFVEACLCLARAHALPMHQVAQVGEPREKQNNFAVPDLGR